jgi:hypothetical protein
MKNDSGVAAAAEPGADLPQLHDGRQKGIYCNHVSSVRSVFVLSPCRGDTIIWTK